MKIKYHIYNQSLNFSEYKEEFEKQKLSVDPYRCVPDFIAGTSGQDKLVYPNIKESSRYGNVSHLFNPNNGENENYFENSNYDRIFNAPNENENMSTNNNNNNSNNNNNIGNGRMSQSNSSNNISGQASTTPPNANVRTPNYISSSGRQVFHQHNSFAGISLINTNLASSSGAGGSGTNNTSNVATNNNNSNINSSNFAITTPKDRGGSSEASFVNSPPVLNLGDSAKKRKKEVDGKRKPGRPKKLKHTDTTSCTSTPVVNSGRFVKGHTKSPKNLSNTNTPQVSNTPLVEPNAVPNGSGNSSSGVYTYEESDPSFGEDSESEAAISESEESEEIESDVDIVSVKRGPGRPPKYLAKAPASNKKSQQQQQLQQQVSATPTTPTISSSNSNVNTTTSTSIPTSLLSSLLNKDKDNIQTTLNNSTNTTTNNVSNLPTSSSNLPITSTATTTTTKKSEETLNQPRRARTIIPNEQLIATLLPKRKYTKRATSQTDQNKRLDTDSEDEFKSNSGVTSDNSEHESTSNTNNNQQKNNSNNNNSNGNNTNNNNNNSNSNNNHNGNGNFNHNNLNNQNNINNYNNINGNHNNNNNLNNQQNDYEVDNTVLTNLNRHIQSIQVNRPRDAHEINNRPVVKEFHLFRGINENNKHNNNNTNNNNNNNVNGDSNNKITIIDSGNDKKENINHDGFRTSSNQVPQQLPIIKGYNDDLSKRKVGRPRKNHPNSKIANAQIDKSSNGNNGNINGSGNNSFDDSIDNPQ